jgi:DNA-binding transcriptional LysR family regulator
MDIRLNDVRNFVACATCRTLSEAAIKLEISQPALTQSIQNLEAEVGMILFYRSRSGVRLTPSGRDFLERSVHFMEAYEGLSRDQNSSNTFGSRMISIGCHPVVAQYSLPKALKALAKAAPDYQIHLRHDLSRKIQISIQRGELDVGIVVNPVEVPDLVIQRLGYDHVSVWRPSGGFDEETIVCNLELFQTQSILKKWKKHPRRILSTESLELVAQMVGEGVGFGILPSRAVELSSQRLKNMSELPSYRDVISLCYRPEFGKSPAEASVLDAIKKTFN